MDIHTWSRRTDLLAGGLSPRQIDQLGRSGGLHRLRRATYVDPALWAGMTDEDRHRWRASEVGEAVAGRGVISHESAALLHGLALPPLALPRVHVTWPGSPGRRGTANVHPHRGVVPDSDTALLNGVALTSVSRTLFDLARSCPASVALPALDSALRTGATDRAAVQSVADRCPRVAGHGRASRLIDFADGRSESVGESICRLRMAQLGLPDPDLQVMIHGAGRFAGSRVDFAISPYRTVVEFDGRIKYGRLVKQDQAPGDVVFEEKRREDAIRATGREFVRIVWDELAPARYRAMLLPRFAAAFARAGFPHWRPGPGRFLADRS